MTIIHRLPARMACKVVGYDPDRLNEQVSVGNFACAPQAVVGRPRIFDPDDMLALKLFVDQMEGGVNARVAGLVACQVAAVAKANPDCPAISFVFDFWQPYPQGYACPHDQVPAVDTWHECAPEGEAQHDVRQVMTFNVAKQRAIIAAKTSRIIADLPID